MTRRAAFLWIALLGAAGLGAWKWTRRPLVRVELHLAPEPWAGLSPEETRGLGLILSDHLETLGNVTVTETKAEPPTRGILRLELSGSRSAAGVLELSGTLEGPDAPPRPIHAQDRDPMAALHQVVDTTLGRWWHRDDALDPRLPATFWPLCRALDAPYHSPGEALLSRLADTEALLQRDAQGLPRLALAHLRYRALLDDSGLGESGGIGWCDEAFQGALKEMPECPRLSMLYANFRTDVGDQRTALELLFAIQKRKPHVAGLYDSLAYAARTMGLLDGAKRAIHQRDELGGRVGQAYFLAENTLLYAGEWEAFERSLQGGPSEPVQDFYRGYAALLRTAPQEALVHFRRGASHPGGIKVFKRLSTVYRLALEGRRDAALGELRALDESRVSVKVPDGEFTFKLAEAYAYLGRTPEALDVASRAFSQGFVCADWYARSPFLAPLRGEPQWEAFLAGLRDRQRRLEQRFPADRFGK